MVVQAQPAGGPALRVVGGSGGAKVGPQGARLRAAGAVRVSEEKQGQGYSPGTQRQAILARAHADGYVMDPEDIYEDHARGHKLTRKGYQAIVRGVREGRYSAVYVFMLDRWGRDSIERQQRGKEFDKLGVPLISIMEGVDEPGLVRVIRAELSEDESRKNAQRVTPNRRRAAREGQHMGQTPYGYIRIYPQWDGRGRRPAGVPVPHEPAASIVREMFARYASGAWATRELAADLNVRGILSPQDEMRLRAGKELTRRHLWSTSTVCVILSNVTYRGDVGYDSRPTGHYLQAPAGSGFVAEGKHEALVSRDLFAEVQRRLADARTYQSVARKTPHAHLVAGLLRCAECGGLMVPTLSGRHEGSARHGQMRCANRHEGRSSCTASGYRLDLATTALLAEVSRLRGAPWTTEHDARLAGDNAGAVASLGQQLAETKATLKRAVRNFSLLEQPSAADLEAMNETRAELGAEIAHLEAQLAQVSGDAAALPRLRALHARFHKSEFRDLVRRLEADGKDVALRDLLTVLVQCAVLVERVPELRSTWLRLEVTWQPDIQTLLDAGLLWLEEPQASAEKPAPPNARDLARRERQRRYRARRKDQQQRAT